MIVFKRTSLWLSLMLIVLLAACGTKSCGSEKPVNSEMPSDVITGGEAPTEEVVLFEPEAGTMTKWWDGSTIVWIPAGEFAMGQDEPEENNHSPAHTVGVDGFWIQQTEVTNRMYAQCVASGVCQPPNLTGFEVDHYNNPDFTNHPVANVEWEDARTYCDWIGGALPNEAQWEWAARGETGALYPWGEAEPNCSRLNYQDCATPTFTMPVNSYPLGMSPFHLADMAGNDPTGFRQLVDKAKAALA